MRTLMVFLLPAWLFATTGCLDNEPVASTGEVSALRGELGESAAASKAGKLLLEGYPEGTFQPIGMCAFVDGAEGSGMRMQLLGTGEMSHLGKITLSTVHCSNPDPASGQYKDGLAVYTAANGDELHATYEQMGAPTDPCVEKVTGGTGRFKNATGEIHVVVIPSIEFQDGMPVFPGSFTATYDGWISYDASDRSGRSR